MSFLDDLIGTLRVAAGGVLKPKQGTLNFVGATVVDDPTNNRTNVAIPASSAATPVASLAALRALSTLDGTVTAGQQRSVTGDPVPWVYDAASGAGFADDATTIVRPNDILVGNNGRWYRSTSSPVLANLTALRLAVSGKHQTVHVQAYSALNDGGGGIFDYDSSDTTSSDNDGTIVVAGSRRYKRRIARSGALYATWFGVNAANADNGPNIVRADTALKDSSNTWRIGRLIFPGDVLTVTTPIQVESDLRTSIVWEGVSGNNPGLRGTMLDYQGADGVDYVVDLLKAFNRRIFHIDIACNGKSYSGWTCEGVEGVQGASNVLWRYCHVSAPKNPATQTFTADATTNVFTVTGVELKDGTPVQIRNSGGALPAGSQSALTYFVRDRTPTTCKLTQTVNSDGSLGPEIDITTNGTGTNTMWRVDAAGWTVGNPSGFQCDTLNWEYCSCIPDPSGPSTYDKLSGFYIRGGSNTKEFRWLQCGVIVAAFAVNWSQACSGPSYWIGGGIGTNEACFLLGECNLTIMGVNVEGCKGMLIKGMNTGGRGGTVEVVGCQVTTNTDTDIDVGLQDAVCYYNPGNLTLRRCSFDNVRIPGTSYSKIVINPSYGYVSPGGGGFTSENCIYLNAPGPYIPIMNTAGTNLADYTALHNTPGPISSYGDTLGPGISLVKATPFLGGPVDLLSLDDGWMKSASGVVNGHATVPGSDVTPDFVAQNVTTTGSMAAGTFIGVGTGTRAGSGKIRSDNGFTLYGRGAGAYDNPIIQQSGDGLIFGDQTHTTTTLYEVASGNLHEWFVGSSFIFYAHSQGVEINQQFLSFGSAVSAPSFLQATDPANVTGQKLLVQAQQTGGTGGGAELSAGPGTTKAGYARLAVGPNVAMCEAVEIAAGRRVLSLAKTGGLSTGEMGANTGDGVVYLANAQTNPSADPASGVILYSDGGTIKFREATAPPTYTTSNHSDSRSLDETGATTAQVAHVLGTLIADLQTRRIIL